MIGMDYHSGVYDVVLDSEEINAFFNISIFEDEITENDESFALDIISETLPSRVSPSANQYQSTVVIKDTTGKKYDTFIFAVNVYIAQ